MNQPKKWTEVYAHGTKAGDEEMAVFKVLARGKYDYRSVGAIVKESGISRERVEEIIHKYATKHSPPLIVQHPTNEDNWGYWERNLGSVKKPKKGVAKTDKDDRVKKHMTSSPSMTTDPFGSTGVTADVIQASTVQEVKTSDKLMSEYDVLTKWLKFSPEEADDWQLKYRSMPLTPAMQDQYAAEKKARGL